MTDEHDLLPELPDDETPDDLPLDDDDYAVLPGERFDDALDALESYDDAGSLDDDVQAASEEEESPGAPEEDYVDSAALDSDLAELDEDERLRQPRAQLFRRRLRNQVNMLPLALYLLALGGYLIARQQDVDGLPDLSTLAIGSISVLALAFTIIFRALLNGRRERGLLLIGLWVWTTAGMLFVLLYGIDQHADAREWWPLLLWSLGAAFVLLYPIERTHDTRLIWLGIITVVAGCAAYGVTSDQIDRQSLHDAAEYWPLLLSVAGIGLLPLAFPPRIG
jgi:peptidoglycan/LPS O-acetylase OafA/YrhL